MNLPRKNTFLKLKSLFLTLCWILLHFIYHLVSYIIHQTRWDLKRGLKKISSCFPGFSQDGQLSHYRKNIQRMREQKKKVPRHLGLVVFDREPLKPLQALWLNFKGLINGQLRDENLFKSQDIDLEALAKVVCWAWIADMQVISLYDYHGFIKANYRKLVSFINQEINQSLWIIGQHDVHPIVKVHNGPDQDTNKIGKVKNGFSNGHTNGNGHNGFHNYNSQVMLHICLFSNEDGKDAIVKSCKQLSKELMTDDISSKEVVAAQIQQISELDVDKRINSLLKFPVGEEFKADPELLCILGNVKSTIGFLPWHIRLSELHWLPSLQRVDVADFFKSFQRYAKCHQRFGT